jgi:ABC-type siderophore export system fused ATPase/permease subunit
MGYQNTHSAKVLLICVIIILIGMPIKFFDERKKYLKEQKKKKEKNKKRKKSK